MDDLNISQVHNMHHPYTTKERQIQLWHPRLGHLSFPYLKHVFPDLFMNFQISDLKCDTFIVAKSHRVTYPLSTNKNDTLFALIHSDVQGPSPVMNMYDIHWFVIFMDDYIHIT